MKGHQLPLIRIKYGWHLDGFFKSFTEFNPKFENKAYPAAEEVKLKIKEFGASWEPLRQLILSEMTRVLNLDFFQNTIDVYVVGRSRTFSDPLVISSHFPPDEFVDILTHELIHRILTDNTKSVDVKTIWEEMFPGKERLVRNHVLVHAVHEHLYREIMQDTKRLERDIKNSEQFPAYRESWDIVRKRGYKDLIEEFKGRYS